MRRLMMAAAFALPMFGGAAIAQETVKIGYIDPLSGGGASIGEVGLKTFQFLADELNAKGGILGKKVEIVPLDNKTNPQESLIQAQKAIDAGVRYITQGNGSSVAGALSDFVTKYNERNPGKEVLYFNYAAVDPVLTNAKCSFWHFRWDANSDIKMEALTNYMKTVPAIKNVYLINQDYSFGESVRSQAKAMLAAKRPDIKIVGDELHPLQKITDFAPYVAKIKASGADTIITGLEQQRHVLCPVAGNDGVSAGRLDLGYVRCEIGDLLERVELVADDLDVRPFGGQHLTRRGTHRLTEGVVLIDQIDFPDVGARLHVVGQRFHLDVGIGVEPEMPEIAFFVGQHRIDRRIVKIEHFLAGIALVELGDEIRDRCRHSGAVALGDNADAGVDGLLHLNQRFLRIELVVVADDLDPPAQYSAFRIQLIGNELICLH